MIPILVTSLLCGFVGACLVAAVYDYIESTPRAQAAALKRSVIQGVRVAHAARYNCDPDGVAITSIGMLRDLVIGYDRLATHGDIHGRRVATDVLQRAVRAQAMEFGDPERGAFLLTECLYPMKGEYRAGWTLLYDAFMSLSLKGGQLGN